MSNFSATVADLLSRYSAAELPLTHTGACHENDAKSLEQASAASLFPNARDPEAALSGLLLLLGCWDLSHTVAQDKPSREASYWHAIVHRMEPDSANSSYWFRRVGQHPIFSDLHQRAAQTLEAHSAKNWRLKDSWDPFLFIEWCDEVRNLPGSDKYRAALQIQKAEWELLFDYCASGASQ